MPYAFVLNGKFVDIFFCNSEAAALELAKKISIELGGGNYNVVAC